MFARLKGALLQHKFLVSTIIGVLVVALIGFLVMGRSGKPVEAAAATTVGFVPVEQKDVPIYSEWIGTLDGMVNAEIRAQGAGYLLKQNYKEGALVKKGELLFEIDPRPFEAALGQANGDLAKAQGQQSQVESQLAQAEAQLAQANSQLLQAQAQFAQSQANQRKAQLDEDKYTPLAAQKAVTQQDLDNAVQSNAAAKAQVESSQAAVRTAELNLGFTRIVSPIDGIVGIAQAQVGNLVNPTSGLLTAVSTVDPIKVVFTLNEREYLNFTKKNLIDPKHNSSIEQLELKLVLADGSTYPEKGRFYLADRQVDPKTGAIRLAGIFPNPGNVLRPGLYGRVRAIVNTREGALVVPQRAVTELQGGYQVAVVDGSNKVDIRSIKVGERVGSEWIIEDGVKPGERVVVEGLQKIRQGVTVVPRPYTKSNQPAEAVNK